MRAAQTTLTVSGLVACLLSVALSATLLWQATRGPCSRLSDLPAVRLAAPFLLAGLGPILLILSAVLFG